MKNIWPGTSALFVCLLGLTLLVGQANAQANFTLTVAPAALTVTQGTPQTATVLTSISGGFNNPVSLSSTSGALGVSISFSPATIPAPGAGTSVVTINAFRFARPGTYPVTIAATGGGVKQTATIALTVVASGQPNFTLSAVPSSFNIVQGTQANSVLTTAVSGGFSNDVNLSASGMPSGITVSFDQNPIPAPGAGVSNMTIAVAATTPVGMYAVTVSATGGGVLQAVAVLVNVTSFTISASPVTLSIAPGNQGTSTITTGITSGFNYPISLSAAGLPFDTTVTFSPPTIPAPGSGNSTMTIAVATDTPPGTYPITVMGNGGGLQQTASVTLTVLSADYTLSATPSSLPVVIGKTAVGSVTTRINGAFNSSITLSASGAPTGLSVIFSPSTVSAPGVGNSTVTILTIPRVSPGTYPITVTANGGGIKHTASFNLAVTAPKIPNFTLVSAPASLNVIQGGQGNTSITALVGGGFNSTISLSASGVPAGTNVTFNQNTIAAPGNGNTPVNVAVSSSTAAGTYPITVTGSGGGLYQTATVTLTVVPSDTQALPTAMFIQPYSTTLSASFGVPPYSFALISGSLPPGLSVDTSGNLTGNATAAGQFPFSVQVSDSSQPQQQQTLDYTIPVVVGLDTYSGYTAAPVPGCTPTGFFQVIKANGRWVFADPLCNGFYQRSVYDSDYQFILPQIFQQHYNSDPTLWATHELERMQSYGFNALDIYTSSYMLPIGTWGRHSGASIQLPFALYYGALNDVVNHPTDLGIPERIKDLCSLRDGNGFIGWCQYSLDIFDPKWAVANAGELANQLKEYTGGFSSSPWIIGITLGDASNVFSLTGNGASPYGASQYPHAAMLVATVNFQANGFLDNTIYSKYAWAAYLQTKYGTIDALNAAWNTGGFYTSFGTNGGFGIGSGILDEDGRNSWYGTDRNRFYTLVGVNSNLVGDLNAFLYQYAYQAYGVQASTIRTYDTSHLLICGTFGGVGDGGTRPQVLQALKDSGCNVFVWNWNAYYTSTALNSNQAEYDTVGVPAVLWYGTSSQLDSDYSSYPYPKSGAPFGDYPNQAARGLQYSNDMQQIFMAQGTNGDYYSLGTAFWGLTDNTSETTNWGLISLMDNTYDGQCAVMPAGTDPWGYACGGEAANYGDLLDAVTQSNSSIVQQLVRILQNK